MQKKTCRLEVELAAREREISQAQSMIRDLQAELLVRPLLM
jgi:hypothetical protein